MLDIYYLRETPEAWEIFGWASRDQRIRPGSWWGGKSKRKGRKFYRDQEKMLLRVEFEGGAALNAGAILRG